MKFLIVKLSALGDILQSFPVLEYLKATYPGCTIDWIVEEKGRDLVERHPLVDKVYTADRSSLLKSLWQMRKTLGRYDRVIDLQGNCKSAIFTFVAKSPIKVGFGRPMVAEWPNLLVTNHKIYPPFFKNRREDYLRFVTDDPFTPKGVLLKISEAEQASIQPYLGFDVLLAHGSMWESKRIAKEQWLNLLKRVEGKILLAWGSPKEKEESEWLHQRLPNSTLLPKLSLPCLQHVMGATKLVLSVDSLALHLAGTTETKTVSFFGPSSSQKYAPVGEQHVTYQGKCPFNVTFERRCPKLRTCPDAPCTKSILVDPLVDKSIPLA